VPERIDMRIPTASLMARAYQYPGLRLLRNVERAYAPNVTTSRKTIFFLTTHGLTVRNLPG